MSRVAARGGLLRTPQSHFDPLGKLTRHRQFNRPISRQLMRDSETLDLARRIANCSCHIKVQLDLSSKEAKDAALVGAKACNARLCPFCEWRRTRAWRARLVRGLEAFHLDFPKHKAIFLTLTVKNCELDRLSDQMTELHKSWHRLTKLSFFPTEYWFRRTEVTVSAPLLGSHQAHPHIHALLLVGPSYFGREYIKQLEWQKQWMMSARLDYSPVVDVRNTYKREMKGSESSPSSLAAVTEAAKYATKATNLLELGDALGEFHRQLAYKRLYASSKLLQPYVKDCDIQKQELVEPDLLTTMNAADVINASASWFEDSQEYLISGLD